VITNCSYCVGKLVSSSYGAKYGAEEKKKEKKKQDQRGGTYSDELDGRKKEVIKKK